jgi:anti-sigma regulatory factor (Ser/Thr protein kinase)
MRAAIEPGGAPSASLIPEPNAMSRNTLTVPAALESLSEIGRFVLAEADAAGLDSKARYRLRLAVDELATNAILYGNSPGAETAAPAQFIVIHSDRDEGNLTILLEDTGVPFDPREVPPPANLDRPLEERQIGGLGIYLALTGVDRYRYERDGAVNRSVLVMHRPAPG